MSDATRDSDAMRPIKLITIAMAALLLIGAAAAVGTATPAEHANDSATEAADENAAAVNASAQADNATEHVGPTGELPEPAPDFVSQIHSIIEHFLDGAIDSLGEALHGLLSPR